MWTENCRIFSAFYYIKQLDSTEATCFKGVRVHGQIVLPVLAK